MPEAIFIELYLDEDVDVLIAELIRAKGFVVETSRDADNLGVSDSEQIRFAAENSKVLVTHNRVDFEVLVQHYFEEAKTHAGIIIASRHSAHEVSRRLLLILNHVTADEMINQIRYI